MKKICLSIITFFVFSLSLMAQNGAAPLQTINCEPSLQPYLLKMLRVPEIRNFIASVQSEGGPFSIDTNRDFLSQQFGAYWDVDHRVICVNLSAHKTEGEVIGSLLFELQNAASHATIQSLDRAAQEKKIDRNQYIESIEYMEYKNSLNAAALAKKGIERGLFPQDACLPTYKNFTEHFYYQQVGGHSAAVGKNYDHLMNAMGYYRLEHFR